MAERGAVFQNLIYIYNGFATEGGEIKTRYLYFFFSFDESNHYFI